MVSLVKRQSERNKNLPLQRSLTVRVSTK